MDAAYWVLHWPWIRMIIELAGPVGLILCGGVLLPLRIARQASRQLLAQPAAGAGLTDGQLAPVAKWFGEEVASDAPPAEMVAVAADR